MKILWLCNIMLPNVAKSLNKNINNNGGWLIGLLDYLKNIKNINLTVCFPIENSNKVLRIRLDGVDYYGFYKIKKDINIYDSNIERQFKEIIKEVNPDIVHIFGTEFPHTLAMIKAFNNEEKIIINIQGLSSIIYKHYLNGIPKKFQELNTFRDFIKKDNIRYQKESFKKRGLFEIEAIKNSKNIIGRTTWDKTSVFQINKNLKYYFCNEILRNEFYKHKWDLNKCEKHSIFISQGSYPVKGLHFILEAMPYIIKEFPQTHLYIGGANIIKNDTIKDKLRTSSYSKYILTLINKYNLKEYITFTGNLQEKEMCKRYLKSNVFVCPSTIENSPNSLGEAMILGVPSVASYVGGIPDMMEHKKEGFLYQTDAPYMLAKYICDIFKNEKLAINISKAAREKALITHDKEINTKKILEIYKNIIGE